MKDQNLYYLQTEKIQAHYEKISDKYDGLWEFDSTFVEFISKNIVNYLELKPTDRLVDIGCGTGIFTQKVRDLAQLAAPVICVDPSSKMLDKIPLNGNFIPLALDGITFANQPGKYNKILLKHMMNVIEDKEGFIKSLFNRLPSKGRLLLIMMPPQTKHPFFEAAIKRYEELQTHYKILVDIFLKVGFEITVDFVEYPVSVDKINYFKILQNCYMSFLSSFSQPEIQLGINELEQKYSRESIISFQEIYIFISGKKL